MPEQDLRDRGLDVLHDRAADFEAGARQGFPACSSGLDGHREEVRAQAQTLGGYDGQVVLVGLARRRRALDLKQRA